MKYNVNLNVCLISIIFVSVVRWSDLQKSKKSRRGLQKKCWLSLRISSTIHYIEKSIWPIYGWGSAFVKTWLIIVFDEAVYDRTMQTSIDGSMMKFYNTLYK